jgi:uncharacterized protein
LQITDTNLLREFVIAGHGNLSKVKELLTDHPELLDMPYPWTETDKETAIMAAAQTGNAPVAEYLLSKGAPMSICTAAMLGRTREIDAILSEHPEKIHERGAHGIPLLAHAALSGKSELVRTLFERGATEGSSFAMHNAASHGYQDMAKWLLENAKPDVNWRNYQGKTALTVALERKDEPMVSLLRTHGGQE